MGGKRVTFSERRQMGRRQRDHPSRIGKHWSCTFCAKVFISYDQLKVHMNVHTKERPFECDQCPANFRYSSAMYVHKKVHRKHEQVTSTRITNQIIRQASPLDVDSSFDNEESQINGHGDSPGALPSHLATDLVNVVEVIALAKCKVVLPRLEKSWTGSKEDAEAVKEAGGDNIMEMESEVNVIPPGSVDISNCSSIEKEENEVEIEEPEKPEVEKIFSCELCSCWFFKEVTYVV